MPNYITHITPELYFPSRNGNFHNKKRNLYPSFSIQQINSPCRLPVELVGLNIYWEIVPSSEHCKSIPTLLREDLQGDRKRGEYENNPNNTERKANQIGSE